MARGSSAKSGGGPARIRLVILEAETPDGDLSQVTQAVQNALRPPDGSTSTRRAITAIAQKMPPSNDAPDTADAIDAEEVEMEAAVEEAAPSRPSGPKKYKTPTVLTTVDLTTEPSFEKFANQKNPTSVQMRFLVVAEWFKRQRGTDAIAADHVYTCFRAIGWPSGIEDFSKPLRHLKGEQLMEQKGKGLYAINHLGTAKVDKLGA
jgi:hypothetical protein